MALKFGDLSIERNLRGIAKNPSFVRVRPEDGMVFVCPWCDGWRELSAALEAEGHKVDEGIHEACAAQLMADYRKRPNK